MKRIFYLLGFVLLVVSGCNEDNDTPLLVSEPEGTWKITQIYANDRWGGALYWRNTDWGKQIRFTTTGDYFEKVNQDFVRMATYRVLSATEIELTPLDTSLSPYTLNYSFLDDRMILMKNQFEGVVGEKYEFLFH